MTQRSEKPGHATVWLVDDQPVRRFGLRAQLASAGFVIVREGTSIEDAPDITSIDDRGTTSPPDPDLLVLDGAQGSDPISKAITLNPHIRIMVLASTAEPTALAEAFAAGAHGYVLKRITPGALIESMRLLLAGEKVFPSELSELLVRIPSPHQPPRLGAAGRDLPLSPQEMAITRHLAGGTPNKTIAQALDITEATVKAHVKTLMRKIGVSNRTQAAIWALNNGLAPAAAGRQAGISGK